MKNPELILIEHFLFAEFSVPAKDILGIYLYGSRLWNHTHENSDLDYCIVLKDLVHLGDYTQYESEDLDIHIMKLSYYNILLEKHDIMALEMVFQEDPIKLCPVEFKLDLKVLRSSISSVVSNSWVKSKKKMELESESSNIGLKSLHHSFRILHVGIQIAKYGVIKDYNFISPVRDKNLDNIINPKWEYWNGKLKEQHNKLMTEFRKLAPK